jgi:hypothetical protein
VTRAQSVDRRGVIGYFARLDKIEPFVPRLVAVQKMASPPAPFRRRHCGVNSATALRFQFTTQADRDNSICFGGRRWGSYLRIKHRANSFANRESLSALMITHVSKHNKASESGFTTTPSALAPTAVAWARMDTPTCCFAVARPSALLLASINSGLEISLRYDGILKPHGFHSHEATLPWTGVQLSSKTPMDL